MDQRTAFNHGMAKFFAVGGDLHIAELSVAEIGRRASDYDLTVVTRASKDLAACFPVIPSGQRPRADTAAVAGAFVRPSTMSDLSQPIS